MHEHQMSLEDSYKFCKQLTINADSNFALGFRFLPKPKRDAIYAVYAFNRLADDFADEGTHKSDPRSNLEKWDYLLEECYRENDHGHPVMTAFTDVIRRFNIPKEPFKEAIEGFKMDLTINRYRTFKDLSVYCDRVAGTISTMSLHVFGWKDKKAFEFGKHLSYALQLTNIIRDVGKDIDKNRIYIPLEEMDRFGYTEEELFSRTFNTRFVELIHHQIDRAKDYFKQANPLINFVSNDARYTVVMIGAVYARLLKKIVEEGLPVLDRTVSLSAINKVKLAFKMRMKPGFI
ncbi:phytoene/squalene synthase family protein [candidate division KSB1 bacterium]